MHINYIMYIIVKAYAHAISVRHKFETNSLSSIYIKHLKHWLTAKKGVHQFRFFPSNMRTPKSMTKPESRDNTHYKDLMVVSMCLNIQI